jgi:hypothetical protein
MDRHVHNVTLRWLAKRRASDLASSPTADAV